MSKDAGESVDEVGLDSFDITDLYGRRRGHGLGGEGICTGIAEPLGLGQSILGIGLGCCMGFDPKDLGGGLGLGDDARPEVTMSEERGEGVMGWALGEGMPRAPDVLTISVQGELTSGELEGGACRADLRTLGGEGWGFEDTAEVKVGLGREMDSIASTWGGEKMRATISVHVRARGGLWDIMDHVLGGGGRT